MMFSPMMPAAGLAPYPTKTVSVSENLGRLLTKEEQTALLKSMDKIFYGDGVVETTLLPAEEETVATRLRDKIARCS